MIKHYTTFVVGAGASVDFGLPLGGALTSQIADALDFNRGSATAELMRTAILHLAHRPGSFRHLSDLFEQARLLRSGLTTAVSIDHFIDSRSDTPIFALLGKMAIAACLMTAEGACQSLLSRRPGELLDLRGSEGTWLACLFKTVMAPGVRKVELEKIFENVSFVVFNYDRCVEHYFTHAIATHFTLDLATAEGIVSKHLRIVHPYGDLGPLFGENANAYGSALRAETHEAADAIYAMSQRLLTFTESQYARAAETKAMMENALRWAFLGFGFGDQNMELLNPSRTTVQEVRATVKCLSRSNRREVLRQLEVLTGRSAYIHPEDHLLDGDCSSLIANEQMFLTRR